MKKLLVLLLCMQLFNLLHAETVEVSSPNNQVKITIKDGEQLSYSVYFQGKQIILDSHLGFLFTNEPLLGQQVFFTRKEATTIKETWKPLYGKHSEVLNNANELRISLSEQKYPKRSMDLIVRAYNDGVAFRYFLPNQHGFQNREITKELTEFRFPQNHQAWMANYGSYHTSQETEFWPGKMGDLTENSIIGLPFTLKIDEHCYASITEANITDWAGFYIGGDAPGEKNYYGLHVKLAPLPGQNESGVKVKISGDHYSPWRVIMLGTAPGRLVESEIISNLNEPSVLGDASWIKPGLCAWDHWWSAEVKMDTETLKKYIQFASDMGFPYQLIDWQWYGKFNAPDADITKINPAVDMPEVLRFAKEKNVKCWVWLYNTDAERQYKEAFALYEKWGIAGVKIDFMDRDDQEMVNWYHKIIKAAAEHHLMVNFHGAYKPDGISRTYPNYIVREGVMGNEYSKWSTRVTPEHNTTLPYTRMLAGPMDYTPGGFVNRTPDKFKVGIPANVMNTRCHQLAMFVVYDGPITTVCDHPDNYYNQPGIDFLKVVPTTWDDTHVLAGEIGQFIVTARKSGNNWFIGAMNNSEARELEIKLDFLGQGNYNVTQYADAPDANVNAEKLTETKITADKTMVLKIKMAPGGGYAAVLKAGK